MKEAFEVERRGRERAVLVAVFPKKEGRLDESMLDELRSLAETAEKEVVGELVQRRDVVDAAFYIGRGKVKELERLCERAAADVVIFNSDLSPAQGRNLERAVGRRTMDRTELILDIFARHASSKQARLQVELAQLEYELPRLKRRWTHLERITGGIGLRGPGEKQIEEDRRVIKRRIFELRKQLEAIDRHRRRLVEARSHFQACLVGYTNAGKTTLLNCLTGDKQLVSSKLFATLDTRTRLWRLSDGKEVLLSDTVGFIRNIPHHLVASFHATLEEALHADLLIQVVDASDPVAEVMIQTVEDVLDEIGAGSIRRLLVLNKADRIKDPLELTFLTRGRDAVVVSAKTGDGIQRLEVAVSRLIEREWKTVKVVVPLTNGVIATLHRQGRVLRQWVEKGKLCVVARAPQPLVRWLPTQNAFVQEITLEEESG